MQRTRSGLFRLALGLITAALVTAAAQAQDGGRLDAPAWSAQEEGQFNKLRTTETAVAPSHAPLLEKKAKYLVYRLTHPENQERSVQGNNTTAGRSINDLYNEFERSLPTKQTKDAVKADKQRKFQEEFDKQLVPAIDKVLKQGAPIARINAARMLARLAESGDEELGDALAALLEDSSQIDAAKYWGAVGMKELFKNAEKVRPEEREARCIQALISSIHRDPTLAADASQEEWGGFYFVRRAYVAALGATHKPALVQNRKVIAQPALELVKIVSKDGLKAIPVISERVEAAIGLGQMQQKHYDNYQPDYAAYHVGQMLMDFIAGYNEERQNPSPIKRADWRIQAARLKEALKTMADDSKNAYVNDLQRRADGLFDLVIENKAVSMQAFANWLGSNPPKSASLYKDDPKAVANLPKTAG